MSYKEFLKNKSQLSGDFGFDPIFMPDIAFDFQRHIIEWSIKKGRAAIFADTGLGKTLMQLSCAENVVRKTNGRVLILTPLAVAFQFIKEGEKIGVEVEHSRDGKFTKKIVVTNYERLHHFNESDFECVILDESSILKNFDGKFKTQVTEFMKKIKYRFLSTATPSPNDFIELGTSSEALGYLGYMDMISKYFTNKENTFKPMDIGTKWNIKPHATDHFFRWVNSWSMSIKKPSDIGYSDERYDLPELIKNCHIVSTNKNLIIDGQTQLIKTEAKGMKEIRAEEKATITERCEKAVELTENKVSVYWTNRNDESSLINNIDSEAVEIKGSMNVDKKEDILLGFAEGNIKRIITKAKMTGFGLNWQHCNHTTFFPTWSYEEYYQAIRRFHRFGQTKNVTVDLILSDGQKRVLDTLEYKTERAIELQQKLNDNLNGYIPPKIKQKNENIKLPSFI